MTKAKPAKEGNQNRAVTLDAAFQGIGCNLHAFCTLKVRDGLCKLGGTKGLVGKEIKINRGAMSQAQGKCRTAVEREVFRCGVEFRPQTQLRWRQNG
ncbi:hypothetical protein MBAV_003713 [Candidatus Magnetobacterium bavaricum]|uniref:Uncharacterized protein n=1 Tax=Candidatus Magnetobacterium bavaricum TaxID=29290 RepID=A0A0F3GTS2_9BACT|nr:hypothetical protein MBAV_003713 [Candidatus Magnetobacterium bavaricum]